MAKQTLAEYTQKQAKQTAIEYAQHYFRTVWTKAGLRWDSDSNAEIELMIEAIIDAATFRQPVLPQSIQEALNSGDGSYHP